MPIIFLIFASLLYIPIWGLLCLDMNFSSFSIFMAMVYTCLSAQYIKANLFSDTLGKLKYLAFIGPLIYLITMFIFLPISIGLLFNPILWCFLTFTFSFYFIKKLNLNSIAAVCFFGYVYAYHLSCYEDFFSSYDAKFFLSESHNNEKDLDQNISLNQLTFLPHDARTKEIAVNK